MTGTVQKRENERKAPSKQGLLVQMPDGSWDSFVCSHPSKSNRVPDCNLWIERFIGRLLHGFARLVSDMNKEQVTETKESNLHDRDSAFSLRSRLSARTQIRSLAATHFAKLILYLTWNSSNYCYIVQTILKKIVAKQTSSKTEHNRCPSSCSFSASSSSLWCCWHHLGYDLSQHQKSNQGDQRPRRSLVL